MISSDRKGLETDSLDVVTEVQNEVDARLYEMSHHPEVAVLVVLTVKHPESKRLGRGSSAGNVRHRPVWPSHAAVAESVVVDAAALRILLRSTRTV